MCFTRIDMDLQNAPSHLNGIKENINFTLEKETNTSINFLGVTIIETIIDLNLILIEKLPT